MRKKKKINSLTTEEQMMLQVNPFVVNDFDVMVSRKVLKDIYKHDKDGDKLPHEVNMESDAKVNVYVASDNRKTIACLGNSGKSLYLHILYELDYGVDYIEIMVDRYMKENDVKSINTYKEGLNNLMRYAIIYPVANVSGVYWINPRYFFAGSRVNKYPDRVKVK